MVFTYKTHYGEADVDALVKEMARAQDIPVETLSGFRGAAVGAVVQGMAPEARQAWARNQVYLALGTLISSAALLGIDACPMEGIERPAYDEILGLTHQGLASTAVVTLGYRASGDKYASMRKVRLPRPAVLQHV